MKTLLLSIALLIIGSVAAFAASPAIRNIDIAVQLTTNGSANITEIWDVTATSGTEWYLVVSNIGDIEISNLSVIDETGLRYDNEGEWDVDRSISEKKGKCGLVHKGKKGYEICWGIGNYGDHIFTVSYTMSNFVKSLNDYDAFNHQFIAKGLSSKPEHAKVTIEKVGTPFDTTSVRIAAFGFIGTIYIIDGKIVAESSEQFRSNSSLIVMTRFDKGIFTPTSVQERDFADMEQKALKGSDYEKQQSDGSSSKKYGLLVLIFVLCSGGLFLFIILYIINHAPNALRKGIFGMNPKDLDWCRELPYKGDILATYYTLTVSKLVSPPNSIASAMVIKMLLNNNISLTKDNRDRPLISFNSAPNNSSEQELYQMMEEAAGDDYILQRKEFAKWLKKNCSKAETWTKSVEMDGIDGHAKLGSTFKQEIWVWKKSRFNEEGTELAKKALGFKKYLQDFTMINNRKSVEVALWREYLVFAALFGIADQVAKELKDINPAGFKDVINIGNSYDIFDVLIWSNMYSQTFTKSRAAYASKQATSWGGGGASSFGGGGGFSGGGFGGGCR